MSNLPSIKNEIIISPSTISSNEISKYFDIEEKELNKIFLNLHWIKKKYFLWITPTELGQERGAVKENKIMYWNRDILGDKELISTINSDKEEVQDIESYKLKIYNKYQKEGYTVWNYSKEKGIFDRNIHFVAKKNKEVLLIHCKVDQNDITIDELTEFQKNKYAFLIENPVFENYQISLQYIMSGFLLDEDAFKYLKENRPLMAYEVIK